MKILLSAYICSPHKGSEAGVGWNWAKYLALAGHDVCVITRKQNEASVSSELGRLGLGNLKFLYFDLPEKYHWKSWSKTLAARMLSQGASWTVWNTAYHAAWQYAAYKFLKGMNATNPFDIVHHVTYASLNRVVFMDRIGVPFVFGPGGGGERAPWRLLSGFEKRRQLTELVRYLSILFGSVSPFFYATCKSAARIYASTEQSRDLVPKKYWSKTQIKLQLGLEPDWILESTKAQVDSSNPRILYVGRFIYLKGMDFGIRAFARLLNDVPNATLTLVGKGPEAVRWRGLAEQLGISGSVNWIEWVDQGQLKEIYAKHDVFLFPSLHDSAGAVVLEALAHGLPVVCLDLGGPAVSVNNSCGRLARTSGCSPDDVVNNLYLGLREVCEDSRLHGELSRGAVLRAKEYLWPNVVASVYDALTSDVSA